MLRTTCHQPPREQATEMTRIRFRITKPQKRKHRMAMVYFCTSDLLTVQKTYSVRGILMKILVISFQDLYGVEEEVGG